MKYYWSWLAGPKLLSHPSEEEKFYQFVKASLRYGGKTKVTGVWLRRQLERDLPSMFPDAEYRESQIRQAVMLFDTLRQFHRTKFPDTSTEKAQFPQESVAR